MTFTVDKFFFESVNKDKFQYEKNLKYIRKRNLKNHFHVKSEDENLYNWLLNKFNPLKNKNECKHLGYINDNVYIVHNPVDLPDAPENWDILCVNGEILEYDYSNSNGFWVKCVMKNSNTFVINYDKLLYVLSVFCEFGKIKNPEQSFFEFLSRKLNVYVITQYFFTENLNNSVEKDKTKNADLTEYYKSNEQLMDKLNCKTTSVLNFAPKNYVLSGFPKISFIIPLNNYVNFHHTILLLNQLNYLNYEIIVVDYLNYEKKVKELLKSQASKIRLIQIDPVDYTKKYGDLKDKKIPFGFILNSAIKCCSGDIIFPFFPNRHYNIDKVEELIKNYLFSNKECFIGKNFKSFNLKDGLIYNYKDKNTCLSNFFFTTKFWLSYTFDESCDNEKTLIYKFIKDRLNMVCFYNSSEWCYFLDNLEQAEKGDYCDFSNFHIDSLKMVTL
jgi:hypothetical protein